MEQLEIKTEVVSNEDIINALRTIMKLPDRITSIDLDLRLGEFPRVNLEFIPTKVEEMTTQGAKQAPDKAVRGRLTDANIVTIIRDVLEINQNWFIDGPLKQVMYELNLRRLECDVPKDYRIEASML